MNIPTEIASNGNLTAEALQRVALERNLDVGIGTVERFLLPVPALHLFLPEFDPLPLSRNNRLPA